MGTTNQTRTHAKRHCVTTLYGCSCRDRIHFPSRFHTKPVSHTLPALFAHLSSIIYSTLLLHARLQYSFNFSMKTYFHLVEIFASPGSQTWNVKTANTANGIRICGAGACKCVERRRMVVVVRSVRHERQSSVSECDQNADEISNHAA